VSSSLASLEGIAITCEHGGNRVPGPYAALFRGRARLLKSHRGYDLGALELSRRLARRFGAPLHASTVTRLLVDLNRSRGHPRLFSAVTRALSAAAREEILRRHYDPYRRAVEAEIDELLRRGPAVLHISVHTFTPRLDGVLRAADIGLLYDPRRALEKEVCRRWRLALRTLAPSLRIRRNYPYRGAADGLTTHLRRRFRANAYAGVELEVSQEHALGPRRHWARLQEVICEALEASLRRETGT
jgi:predicted N-formylglutamate amidohydrolase